MEEIDYKKLTINNKKADINNAIITHGVKRKALFLKSICSDSGLCIAFGIESQEIYDFFKGFITFEYLNAMQKIGATSLNGFVTELEYLREEYRSNAILKSALTSETDNLFYEYLIGIAINDEYLRFPCFVETYGLIEYNNQMDKDAVKDMDNNRRDDAKNALKNSYKFDINSTILSEDNIYKRVCDKSEYLALLIQHIDKPISLHHQLANVIKNDDTNFIRSNLMNILYQIYMPLAILKDDFTHYDLHAMNVLLYTPKQNMYIQYHYHIDENTIVQFKSQYIVKIIDYGHSYSSKINIEQVYEKLCDNCNECGYDNGFNWLETWDNPEKTYYIDSKKRNMSHDLLLLVHVYSQLKEMYMLFPDIFDLLRRLTYNHAYGTKENIKNSNIDANGLPEEICNVVDAYTYIQNLLMKSTQQSATDNYYLHYDKIGDLHIYTDGRPMNYVPTQIYQTNEEKEDKENKEKEDNQPTGGKRVHTTKCKYIKKRKNTVRRENKTKRIKQKKRIKHTKRKTRTRRLKRNCS